MTAEMPKATAALPLPSEAKRAFHHLHASPADMHGNDNAVLFEDARQQQTWPSHVEALPDAQRQLGIPLSGQVGEQRRRSRGGAAGGGIFGKAARSRMKHPRLQVACLLGRRYIASVEIDRVAAVARKRAGERGSIRPGPPQRVARG